MAIAQTKVNENCGQCCTAAETSMGRQLIQKNVFYNLQNNKKKVKNEKNSPLSGKESTLFEQIAQTRESINSILLDVSFVFRRKLAFVSIVMIKKKI